MGFRSTLTTQYYGHELPEWFKEKHKDNFLISNTLVSQREWKFYSGNEFFEDYQKALIEVCLLKNGFKVVSVVLAEDGYITKVIITENEIKYILMEDGHEWDGVWNRG
jgi:hypothetical protein